MDKKETYRKYQIILEHDQKWGFFVNDLGITKIEKGENYPPKGHPGSYMFSWEKGRVLSEFQFVLITEGQGVFESKETGKKKISAGDGFLLFPGIWHRFKPNKNTGWTENWVGFAGALAKQFLANGFFVPEQPVIQKCNVTSILSFFDSLIKLFNDEPFGYQRIASGICIQLMAELYNIQHISTNEDSLNSMIVSVKHLMYKQIDETIRLKGIAEEFGVSYSKFRADFKKQTGTSPLQYFLLLKIEKSKEMLTQTNKSQKEIAYSLGFESDFYFNRLFKQKVGITPRQYREIRR
jgi:AraC-like DNA-binding protein